MTNELRYAFGQNWQSFNTHALNPKRTAWAARSLQSLLGCPHLIGRTFLDIGCGSGLFSLAAVLLGATRVVGFDYDRDSVAASMALRQRSGIDADRWQIMQGSVLDSAFMQQLPMADVVYSWGVLHHTGAMWPAIDAAAACVQADGLFAIAIYNRVERPINNSHQWVAIKRQYNQAGLPIRWGMEQIYASLLLLQEWQRGTNPLTYMRGYSAIGGRGMDFWHDVRDWMGGYPYEYASPEELSDHLRPQGFTPEKVVRSDGLGCNEVVFRRSS
ncbi:MAG: class I SAM-dependent methyltransferase [Roseiflexaceae bacterium]